MFNAIGNFRNYIIINARLIVKEVYKFSFSNLSKVLKKVLDLLENFNFIALDPIKVVFSILYILILIYK